MIIVKLKGGIGNQMFQYALGRRLSLERGVPLKLDLSWYSGNEKRKYELGEFNIPKDLALPEYLYRFPPFSRKHIIDKIYFRLDNLLPKDRRFVYFEAENGNFDPRVLQSKRSRYLQGYWHSEKYFETIKDRIREDFTLKQPLSMEDQKLAEEMNANPRSVSVHIRRGDYVSNFSIIRRFLICTPDYYKETMALIKTRLGEGVVFYVFSDDPDWCRTGLDYPSDFKIVSNGNRSASGEIVMMSNCRHAIMTNSSYSWWGAWLTDNPEKIVIYPKKWFNNQSTPDIPLSNWHAWQHSTENDWKYIDISYAKSLFRSKTNSELNLDDPQRFTEKLQWLKLYDRKPIYTTLADKYSVREYVAEKIGSQYLTKLYGLFEKSSEIEWEKLPNRFVLKTNHGSHWIIRCKDKNFINRKKTCQELDSWLADNYYYHEREWQYKDIPPKIMCEEFLEGDKKFGLLDYRIWCFNGQPKNIEVIIDRFGSTKRAFYDLDWQKMDVQITYPMITTEIPRPVQLAEMLSIAKSLSVGIPFVRVDLYNFEKKIIFGELTIHPAAGFQKINPPDFDYVWGRELILPHQKYLS